MCSLDALLRGLLERARAQPRVWLLVVAGQLLPGLKEHYWPLRRRWYGDSEDLAAELVYGLLEATVADVPEQRVAVTLLWRARRCAERLVRRQATEWGQRDPQRELDDPLAGLAGLLVDRELAGDPRVVVGRAVLERALSWQQAEMVTWVGLDKLALQEVAARLGVSRNTATVRLREAVGRLAGWLDAEVPEGWRRRQRRTPAESPEPVMMRSP